MKDSDQNDGCWWQRRVCQLGAKYSVHVLTNRLAEATAKTGTENHVCYNKETENTVVNKQWW